MTRPQFPPRGPHRAQQRLIDWQRGAPWRAHAWRAVDALRAAHAHAWPRHTYLPLEAAGAIVADAWRATGRTPTPATMAQEGSELATFAAWRVTQGVYRYDPTLAEALVTTPLTGDLPAAALLRLPEWCVYIETPGRTVATTAGTAPLHGYYAWIDHPAEDDHDVLTLGIDASDLPLTLTHVPLVGSLEEAITAVVDQWTDAYARGNAVRGPRPGYADQARQTLPPLLSLLLYLCVEDAEIGDGRRRPERPAPKRTKDGWRLFPAEGLSAWEVGVRIGAAIRSARAHADGPPHEGSGRARPRAHIRRAHWNTYWTGPRDVEQTPVLRWLPPAPVNVPEGAELPTVIHKVDR